MKSGYLDWRAGLCATHQCKVYPRIFWVHNLQQMITIMQPFHCMSMQAVPESGLQVRAQRLWLPGSYSRHQDAISETYYRSMYKGHLA